MPRDFRMKWWGWGAEAVRYDTAEHPGLLPYLRATFGVERFSPRPDFSLSRIDLPPSAFPPAILSAFREALGPEGVAVSQEERIRHAGGKSYRDLLRVRSGRIPAPPDAVLYPAGEEDLLRILALAGRYDIALVPFGGGTSVVGGLETEKGSHPLLAVIDLCRMNRILEIDERSATASVQAGIFGPDLEDGLRARGFTLGHFPQSFEFSTLGGWIAARSAGQNSTYYGKIEDLVLSLRIVTPAGVLDTRHDVPRACGPDLKPLLVGSEGIYGFISSATLRLHPAPAEQCYHGFIFSSFAKACEAARLLLQSDLTPGLLRVSDTPETASLFALAAPAAGFLKKLSYRAGELLLAGRGLSPARSSLVLIGWEGTPPRNWRMRQETLEAWTGKFTFQALGRGPGNSWLKHRFFLPYLRDELMDQGLLVDTWETAALWSRLDALYRAVREAVDRVCGKQGVPHDLYTHVSHLYREGVSLYFTLIARQQPGRELEQWREIKEEASQALLRERAPISHHHGVGMDHKPYLAGNRDPLELELLRELKRRLDPQHLLNPGKIL